MLTLRPPVPTGDFEFETAFRRPNTDALIALSAARRRATTALVPVALHADADAGTVQQALERAHAYHRLWTEYWRQYLALPGACTTRLPVAWRWRIDVFAADDGTPQVMPAETIDPSPLVETACATLAVIATAQRLAALSHGDAAVALLDQASDMVQWLRADVLPRFRPRVRPKHVHGREPYVMSDTVLASIADALRAQKLCKVTMQRAVRNDDAPIVTAIQLFRAARHMQTALAGVPAAGGLLRGHQRAAAGAYRFLAQALMDTNAEWGGVAVACAKEAVHLTRGEAHVDVLAALKKRNDLECGMQAVPRRAAVHVQFGDCDALRVDTKYDDEQRVTVHVPTPPQ